MKTVLSLLIVIVLFCTHPLATLATDEIAERTGRDCGACHLDPSGGGELTVLGEGYLLSLQAPDAVPATSTSPSFFFSPQRLFKLLIGYLHILVGIFWFGTILYVHLILKPAYAAKGLPKGEVKLGLVSIVLTAITGVILTLYRVPTPEFFITTRFGLLLLIKIGLFLLMASSAFFVVFFIGPKMKKRLAVPQPAGDQLTEAGLAYFDGQEGRPAYFAYRDKVYDASASRFWKNGSHMARHNAGMDLTEVLAQAPHGEQQVLNLPVVGNLVAAPGRPTGVDPKRVFFFMAYMNLINVFLIILILTLWKWW